MERAGGLTPNAYLYGSEFTRESTRAVQQGQARRIYIRTLICASSAALWLLRPRPSVRRKISPAALPLNQVHEELITRLRQIQKRPAGLFWSSNQTAWAPTAYPTSPWKMEIRS